MAAVYQCQYYIVAIQHDDQQKFYTGGSHSIWDSANEGRAGSGDDYVFHQSRSNQYKYKKYHRRWRQHRAITVDTVDIVDTVETVDTVDTVETVDTVDTVDTVRHCSTLLT